MFTTPFDYLTWRGDLSFQNDEFNLVDNLILAEISYVDFKIPLKKNESLSFYDACKIIFEKKKDKDIVLGLIVPQSIVKLTHQACLTTRFKDLLLSDYVNVITNDPPCQFSALCFHLPNNVIYVAFRGTDDTLMGWQENLNMIDEFPVPAQKMAKDYLKKIAKKYPDARLYLGGQSKGGNLAVYAGIYSDKEIQDRIITIYNNDGPGFVKEKIDLDRFNYVKDKIIEIIPQSCVVGMLFDEYYGKRIVVKSNKKGVWQHDSLSWHVQGKSFVTVNDVTKNAIKLNDDVDKLLLSLNEREKKDLALSTYNFINVVKKDTLLECQKDPFRIIANITKMPLKSRRIFTRFIGFFFKNNLL